MTELERAMRKIDKRDWCFDHSEPMPCAECDKPCPACSGSGKQEYDWSVFGGTRCKTCLGTGLAGRNGDKA